MSALLGGTAVAQVTMQPIPNPSGSEKAHGKTKHVHHTHVHAHMHAHHHMHHMAGKEGDKGVMKGEKGDMVAPAPATPTPK